MEMFHDLINRKNSSYMHNLKTVKCILMECQKENQLFEE